MAGPPDSLSHWHRSSPVPPTGNAIVPQTFQRAFATDGLSLRLGTDQFRDGGCPLPRIFSKEAKRAANDCSASGLEPDPSSYRRSKHQQLDWYSFPRPGDGLRNPDVFREKFGSELQFQRSHHPLEVSRVFQHDLALGPHAATTAEFLPPLLKLEILRCQVLESPADPFQTATLSTGPPGYAPEGRSLGKGGSVRGCQPRYCPTPLLILRPLSPPYRFPSPVGVTDWYVSRTRDTRGIQPVSSVFNQPRNWPLHTIAT